MVITRLLGGLGNQMFQYAVGKTLAILNQAPLKIDTSILLDHRPGVHEVNRNYNLNIFDISVDPVQNSEKWKYNTHAMPLIGKIGGRFYQLIFGNKAIIEKQYHFDPTILTLRGDLYLAGTWQSFKYFKIIETQIRNDFKFIIPLEGEASEMLKKIVSTKSVCLNVRRADYVDHTIASQSLGFIGMDYYRDAIQLLEKKYSNLHYFIFSDDIAWCEDNFKFIQSKVTLVGHQCAGPQFSHYLQLMTYCEHFIIPNSTFAWWAAWLNQSTTKTVIAPIRWFKSDSVNTSDLIPQEWLRI